MSLLDKPLSLPRQNVKLLEDMSFAGMLVGFAMSIIATWLAWSGGFCFLAWNNRSTTSSTPPGKDGLEKYFGDIDNSLSQDPEI